MVLLENRNFVTIPATRARRGREQLRNFFEGKDFVYERISADH
jgi:hypothetical protein